MLLYRIWVTGEDPRSVAYALRRIGNGDMDTSPVPPLSMDAGYARSFRVTIVDWCRATLESLGAPAARA
jgi:hypothetical protein